ncbi:MAG TPA: hypothetical protein VEK34_13810 [Methylocella sp.]|nr:hypothetical protein [Methylocella sp.]
MRCEFLVVVPVVPIQLGHRAEIFAFPDRDLDAFAVDFNEHEPINTVAQIDPDIDCGF